MRDGTACVGIISILFLPTTLIIVGSEFLKDESKGFDKFAGFSGAFVITLGVFSLLVIICLPFASYVGKEIYLSILVGNFILELTLGLTALETVFNDVQKGRFVRKVFDDYVQNQKSSDKLTVDTVQRNFECCGLDGPPYWISAGFEEYPDSCYKNTSAEKNLYSIGCLTSVLKRITPKIQAIVVISLLLAFIKNPVLLYIIIMDYQDRLLVFFFLMLLLITLIFVTN